MKKHFKMYKAGKLWLTAAIVAFGLWGGHAYAAENQPNTANPVNTQQVVATTDEAGAVNQTTGTAVADQGAAEQSTTSTTKTDQGSQAVTNINGYQQTSTNGNSVWQNSQGQLANGWQQNNNDWYYFKNGQLTNNWQWINNNWYYMNPQSSIMEEGLQKINNSTYYLNSQHDGTYGAMKTGWQLVDGNWYYFNNSGAAATGWAWLNNHWFYFEPTNAQMLAGLQKINNSTYYLNPQHDGTYGAMKTGWQVINGRWYGFGGSGAALTNWQYINGRWYYFDQNGQADINWQSINGHRYYFDLTNAWALTGWQLLNNSWYYFDPANAWELTGWQSINGQRYYLDPTTGQLATGPTEISGQHYYFDQNGHPQTGLVYNTSAKALQYYNEQNGTRQTTATIDGQTYQFDPVSGNLLFNFTNGLNQIGNRYYYYNTADQTLAVNQWQKINVSWYYFGTNAAAATGWYKSVNGAWYYFNNNGTARTDWQYINGHWYYFDPTNAWADTGWLHLGNDWYYLDPTNAWADTGWTFVNHNWYYFDLNSCKMYTGNHWINGHQVHFQDSGAFVGFSQRVINWFLSREGKLTYSMYGSRNGSDGTADCSGSMTQAVYSAGGSTPSHLYSTLDIGNYLRQNGYYIAGSGYGQQDVQYGDIVVWGTSAGAGGHVVIVSTGGADPKCISTCGYYWSSDPNSVYGAAGQAVQEFNYQWYWNDDDRPYQVVYRPNFYWA